ncbi:MAG: TIR domain-containing protein [Terricaulis sp.]
MADIFISYSSEDRNRVRPLAEALQARGFDIWWDRSLAAGQDYASVIDRELRAAKAVIVVWTAGSAASTFVRDEAGRARDEGRLVPVLLDPVQIPLGFGSFQAEDFTRWNGGSNAPQMQILEEALKAKLSGRDVDGAAVARKRRKLMARVRLVSLLTVVFLIVGIAVGAKYFLQPEPEVVQTDLRAELLRLLEEGKLTPEQAIQLATILEAGALGETTNVADNSAPSATSPAPSAAGARSSMTAEEGGAANAGDAALASISSAEFDEAARATFQSATAQLVRHPDASVRMATLQLSQANTRDAAMQRLWAYAQAHPDDPLRDEIYEVCASVGETNGLPLGQQALENVVQLNPENPRAWRMLARSYQRTGERTDAESAALIGSAVQAQAQGDTAVAEQQLQQALPHLRANTRAFVASELGAIAESRQDWSAASARYAEAYRAREQAPTDGVAPTEANIEVDAQRLVRALDRSGRTREACDQLREAQVEHDVNAPEGELVERCQTQFRVPLRARVVAPRATLQQRAPAQQTTPSPQ